MPLASLCRLAVQVVLSAPTRLARDRYANASLILLGALIYLRRSLPTFHNIPK
jgi:hypothetical protein